MQKTIKTLVDRLFACILLIVCFPLFLILAILIRINMGKPIFFSQRRPGKDGRIFEFYKFRTMTNAMDAEGNLLTDAERLTGLGLFLRKSSLDELPQLINVIKGDMSFVGPRPLLVEYLELYTPEQAKRHQVLPGITGWAQINGRNAISWEEKFRLDCWYINHWNLFLDLRILLLTVFKVIKKEDITQNNHATMEKFQGSTSSAD